MAVGDLTPTELAFYAGPNSRPELRLMARMVQLLAAGGGGGVGAPGVGIAGSAINGQGHLIFTMTDGTTQDAGVLPNNGTGFSGDAFVAWFNTLPTTLPSTAGKPWNNGGSLAFS